jgi:Zn-dependent M28 family amino/carboxypeptidase
MGEGNVFNGANDNASGTAALLGLAKHFSLPENQPKYSIAFLFFAAEERGLIGSNYYTENPILPLSKIKALINLDMVGTGSEGIGIVNGEENPAIVSQLRQINTEHQYFDTIKIRPNSCNSDHCAFAKKEIPAVFIYTMGDEFQAYHTLKDNPEDLPLTKMLELQHLMIKYCQKP